MVDLVNFEEEKNIQALICPLPPSNTIFYSSTIRVYWNLDPAEIRIHFLVNMITETLFNTQNTASNLLSFPKITANVYFICISIDLRYT